MSQDSNSRSEDVSAFEDLRRRTQITKKTRFQASERLERRQTLSYLAISFLSLFVILLSLVPNIIDLDEPNKQILLALTILNSVFIIIITFQEASGNFVHKGEQLHRSARKVARVYSKLLLLDETEKAEREIIRDLHEEYFLALEECAFNHARSDYLRVKIEEPELFAGKAQGKTNSWLFREFQNLECLFREYAWLLPHVFVAIFSVIVLTDIVSLPGSF